MSYLVVAAHPDDEILGAGATIKKLAERGEKVHICIMSSKAEARTLKPGDNELQENCFCAEAFEKLVSDDTLRRKMGAYDANIIEAYGRENVAAELGKVYV